MLKIIRNLRPSPSQTKEPATPTAGEDCEEKPAWQHMSNTLLKKLDKASTAEPAIQMPQYTIAQRHKKR